MCPARSHPLKKRRRFFPGSARRFDGALAHPQAGVRCLHGAEAKGLPRFRGAACKQGCKQRQPHCVPRLGLDDEPTQHLHRRPHSTRTK